MTENAVSLDLLKKHLRAEYDDDDAYLSHLTEVAQAYVERATHRTHEELLALGGGIYPLQLMQAILMLAAHWYNQREAASSVQFTEVPHAVSSMIKQFRKLV